MENKRIADRTLLPLLLRIFSLSAFLLLLCLPLSSPAQDVPESEYLHPLMMSPKKGMSYEDFYLTALSLAGEYKNKVIDVKTLLDMLADKNTVVLDVRDAKLYRYSHIKGALHLPFDELKEDALAALVPSRETRIVLCTSDSLADYPIDPGQEYMALPALYVLGYKQSYKLQHGMKSVQEKTFDQIPVVYPEE